MRLVRRGETWFAWFYQDGKRVRRSTRCRDRRAAEAVAREFERAAADPLHPSRQTATVGDAVTLLLTHREGEAAAGRRSAATVRFYREKAGHWTRVLGADFRLSKLTAADVDGYVNARRAEGFAENTIAKELVAMRAALKLAKRAGKWFGDVAAIFPVAFAPEYEPRRRVLSAPELYRLLEQLEPDRAARVAFLVATGARLGESDRARREDVERHEGETCDFARLRGTKTAAARRTVPVVTPLARQLLKYALDHAGGDGGLLFRPWPKLHRDVLRACRRAGCKATGCGIKPSRRGGCRRPECVAAAIAPFTPNDLRRTCATWLREAGTPVELVAPVLGHVDVRMALRVYARLDANELGQRIAESTGWTAGGPHSPSPVRRMRQGRRDRRVNSLVIGGPSGTRTQDQRIKSPLHLLPKPAKPHHKSHAARAHGLPADRESAPRGK
jgi:integrase